MMLAAILAVVLAAAAPALAGSRSGNDSAKGNPGKGNPGHKKHFASLVDIGGGRKVYMKCQGKGSPTVVFVAGAGDRAETWSKTLDRSKQAVLPAIAKTNRVCAYDRPGTFVVTGDGEEDFATCRSDPVDQPTTLQDGAADLHALLRASGERGPYLVVAHSMGGAIAKLYASEHPREVSGLVLIDYTPYDARNLLTGKQWGYWKILLGSPSKEALDLYPDIEWFDHQRNLKEVRAADPLKPMPFIVFSSDEPYDVLPYVEDGRLPLTPEEAEAFGKLLFQAVLDARSDLVSQVPGARHIKDTHSGHYIHQVRPKLVIKSIREVVGAARKKACALGSKNHGQCIEAVNHGP